MLAGCDNSVLGSSRAVKCLQKSSEVSNLAHEHVQTIDVRDWSDDFLIT